MREKKMRTAQDHLSQHRLTEVTSRLDPIPDPRISHIRVFRDKKPLPPIGDLGWGELGDKERV